MIHRIIADSIGTTAKRMSGTLSNAGGNGILISSLVGGTGHTEARFLTHVISATIRQAKGEDIPLISGLRVMDAFKVSDYKGGFSADLANGAAGRYVAFIPCGRVRLEGDDVLDVQVQCEGHATATYGYTVSLVDMVSGPDVPVLHELITGNGADQLIRDCYALYLVSDPTGATITVKDEAGKNFNLVDNDLVDLSNALGQVESFEEVGVIFSDPFDLSQDIRVKLPASTFAVAARGFFDVDRLMARSRTEGLDQSNMFERIRLGKPSKARFLESIGKGA